MCEAAEQQFLELGRNPRRVRAEDAASLERMGRFLAHLDNPHLRIPRYIHITGTSGKGSVANFLRGILHAAGFRVGSITSPHPVWMRERIHLGNSTLTVEQFSALAEEFLPAARERLANCPEDLPPWPHLINAAGFLALALAGVEIGIVEVGHGGRFDSTNVIPRKEIAVITNIGLDHTRTLGPTRADIAWHKAGIIAPECRVFTMERDKKMLEIIRKECEEKRTELKVQSTEYRVLNNDLNGANFKYRDKIYHIGAIGEHQVKNAALCIDIARSLEIPDGVIARGLADTRQPLRMEIISRNPLVILDGAHNPDKIQTTINSIKSLKRESMKADCLHLVVGFSANKNWRKMVKQLAALNPASVACAKNTINPFRKAAEPDDIARLFRRFAPQATIASFLTPTAAYAWSVSQMSDARCQMSNQHDILLATGSIFLSGELRGMLTQNG